MSTPILEEKPLTDLDVDSAIADLEGELDTEFSPMMMVWNH
ncbi:hypothetical protein [Bifidobacterium bohemicum]|nr:hypothetical protein [Bifidobacterium bohemicum]